MFHGWRARVVEIELGVRGDSINNSCAQKQSMDAVCRDDVLLAIWLARCQMSQTMVRIEQYMYSAIDSQIEQSRLLSRQVGT